MFSTGRGRWVINEPSSHVEPELIQRESGGIARGEPKKCGAFDRRYRINRTRDQRKVCFLISRWLELIHDPQNLFDTTLAPQLRDFDGVGKVEGIPLNRSSL